MSPRYASGPCPTCAPHCIYAWGTATAIPSERQQQQSPYQAACAASKPACSRLRAISDIARLKGHACIVGGHVVTTLLCIVLSLKCLPAATKCNFETPTDPSPLHAALVTGVGSGQCIRGSLSRPLPSQFRTSHDCVCKSVFCFLAICVMSDVPFASSWCPDIVSYSSRSCAYALEQRTSEA